MIYKVAFHVVELSWQSFESAVFFGVNISRCRQLRGKSFNWLVKCWHRRGPALAGKGEKMLYKAIFIASALFTLYSNSLLLWTRRRFTSWIVPSQCSLRILSMAFFGFQSNVPSTGMASEATQCHQVWNYAVSIISPDKLPYEQNLTLMEAVCIRVLNPQSIPFIPDFNCSNYGIRWTVSICIWPESLCAVWELKGKILSGWADDRFGYMCSWRKGNGKKLGTCCGSVLEVLHDWQMQCSCWRKFKG